MAEKKENKDLWVGWTRDAMSRYSVPDDVEDTDEQVDDMIDVATKYADSMLDEYEERFSGGSGGGRRRRRKTEDEE